jgi:monoamine oxidase
VIEARDRVGGRVHSVDGDDWPFPVELGAAVPLGEAAVALRAALALAGVALTPLEPTVEARDATGTVVSGAGPSTGVPGAPLDATSASALARAADWAAGRAGAPTLAEALAGSGADQVSAEPDDGVSDADRLAFVVDEVLPVRFGADASALAARELDVGGAVGVAALVLPADAALVTGGFSSFVTEQLRGLDVLRDSNVVRIRHGDEGVGLRTATGESLSADRAVVTVPLGVLKEASVQFSPELPRAHLDAIDALGVGHQEVLWLRFDRPFWSTASTLWVIADESARWRVFVNLQPITGEPVLVALTGGDAALATLELDDDEAVAQAMSSLQPYLDLLDEPVPDGTAPADTDSPEATPAP